MSRPTDEDFEEIERSLEEHRTAHARAKKAKKDDAAFDRLLLVEELGEAAADKFLRQQAMAKKELSFPLFPMNGNSYAKRNSSSLKSPASDLHFFEIIASEAYSPGEILLHHGEYEIVNFGEWQGKELEAFYLCRNSNFVGKLKVLK